MSNFPIVRFQTLDVMRGIALLGILIVNVQTYGLFAFLRPEQVYDLNLDQPSTYRPVQFITTLLVKGQFYTIFSFLFGLGFFLMLQKNIANGLDGERIFKRRLWALLLIGLIHAFVFWFGDILHRYALLGFTLIFFHKKSVNVLFKWIAGMVLFVIIYQFALAILLPVSTESQAQSNKEGDVVIMQVVNAWQHGSVSDVLSLQWLGVVMLVARSIFNGFAAFIHSEIMFILGIIVGKLALFHRVDELKAMFLRSAWILLPFALTLKVISCLDVLQMNLLPANLLNLELLITSLCSFVSMPMLALCYIIFLAVFLEKQSSVILTWIANTGRMGLTNYLMQTLLCMIVFYGYAMGYAGKLTLAETLIPVAIIYVFQVLYSNIWLNYYKMGPMEHLWRKLTYGKIK
ncbi:MAG: DUF418 domain-containing protein [Pedobacter sp.]|nr:MAG: DUF418 domain-containing protein [Pedobacter sp.]